MLRPLHAVTVLALLPGLPLGSFAATGQRPNLFLFLADNWSWPHASILGDATVKTPVFDRIVREGGLFQHAFCPVPSCSPTRASLLTGRAAHQLGEAASLWSAFPRKWRVFPEVLRQAGYEIGYCGKGWSPGNYRDFGWEENPAGPEFADFADFLKRRDPAKPFFFWTGNTSTSLNKWRYEPEGWAGLDPASVRVPPELPDVEAVRLSLLAYYGGVMRVDADAGTCVAELEQRHLLDETVFVYASDNGWQMPRGLANCYDSGTRVPLAIRWGARITPGRRMSEFVNLTDLAPTFLELAGLEPLPEMTGRSFRGLLLGEPSPAARDHVFLERERHANVRRGDLSYPVRGVRNADFLYLWNLRPSRWPAGDPEPYFAVGAYGDVDGSRAKEFVLAHQDDPAIRPFYDLSFGLRPEEELYDLRRDPHQLTNVALDPAYATARNELKGKVQSWMRETGDPRTDPACDHWDGCAYYGPRAFDESGKPVVRKPGRPRTAP